eukprot:gene6942-biopygen7461
MFGLGWRGRGAGIPCSPWHENITETTFPIAIALGGNGRGRAPYASHTIEFEETGASRARPQPFLPLLHLLPLLPLLPLLRAGVHRGHRAAADEPVGGGRRAALQMVEWVGVDPPWALIRGVPDFDDNGKMQRHDGDSTGDVSPDSTGDVSPDSTGDVSPDSTGDVSPDSTGDVSPAWRDEISKKITPAMGPACGKWRGRSENGTARAEDTDESFPGSVPPLQAA